MSLILNKDNPLATKVQTRGDDIHKPRPARIIATDYKSQDGQVLLAAIDYGTYECVGSFYRDGIYAKDGNPSAEDLINVVEKQKWWVNVYSHSSPILWTSRENADSMAGPNRLRCVEVEL